MNIKKIKIGDKVRAIVLKSRYQAWQNMEVVNIVNGSLIICEYKNGESILQAGFVADELFPLPLRRRGWIRK